VRFCALCRHQAKETDRFCIECGTSLGGSGHPGIGLPGAGERGSGDPFGSLRDSAPSDPFGYLYAQPGARTASSRADVPPAAALAPDGLALYGWGPDGWGPDGWGPAEPFKPGEPLTPGRRRGRWRPVALAAAVVLAAAASGFAALHVLGHQQASAAGIDAAADGEQHASVAAKGPPPGSGTTSSATASTPGAPPATGTALVGIAAGAVSEPHAQPVTEFLTRYFSAVNRHNYLAYRILLTPGIGARLTPRAFRSGYGTTADSAVTLRAVSVIAAAGRLAATITFTSRQDPADSPAHSACTAWSIVLYLVPHRAGYLIGKPPPSYHAAFRGCG
jgi:hypothetical protein